MSEEPPVAVVRALRLLEAERSAASVGGSHLCELLDFIETILAYKLPRSSREEIRAMLGVTDIDLKKNRFFEEVHAEGRQEGREDGRQKDAAPLCGVCSPAASAPYPTGPMPS